MVEGMLGFTVSTADRIATFGDPKSEAGVQVDGVLDDVALGHQIGRDVDGGIGDEERLWMVRNVHDEDVADAPAGAQPGLTLGDRAEKLVGMQAALHQQLGLARAHELDRFLGRLLTVRNIDDLDASDVETVRLGNASNPVLRSDQNGHDHVRFGRLQRSPERGLVAGMRDGSRERLQTLGRGHQAFVLLVLSQLGDDRLFGSWR